MIIFFGPAGSGKSVQGQMLAAKNGWNWLSMGELLRDTSDKEIQEFMKTGQLVPNDKTNQILSEKLVDIGDSNKVIIDGYPRHLDQAEWLVDNQVKYGYLLNLAIVIDVPKDELLKRLSLRGRSDDNMESIEKRLQIYSSETYPILEYLGVQGVKVAHIDGLGTKEQIHERVLKKLSECDLI